MRCAELYTLGGSQHQFEIISPRFYVVSKISQIYPTICFGLDDEKAKFMDLNLQVS